LAVLSQIPHFPVSDYVHLCAFTRTNKNIKKNVFSPLTISHFCDIIKPDQEREQSTEGKKMTKYYINEKLVRTSKVSTYTHAVIRINPNTNEWSVHNLCSGIDKAQRAMTAAHNADKRWIKNGAKFDWIPKYEVVELVKE
jgi:hypothetical protein